MGLLAGKVAAITGAGGGIGRAHALLFAKEGAKVVVNDLGGARDGSGQGSAMADQVCQEIRAAGGEGVPSYDDVSDRSGAEQVVKTAVDAFGKLDILVNNAGILRDKTMMKMDEAMWDLVVKVHLRGTFLCTQAACKHMAERGQGGRIITTTSVSGLLGNFGQANYSSAKAGIYGFTRTCSMELKKYRITCNALAPVALTRLTEDLPMMSAMPNAKDFLAPECIAPPAVFLASDQAADITGQIVAVEGPRVYLFKMISSDAITARDGTRFTPQEIAERWKELGG